MIEIEKRERDERDGMFLWHVRGRPEIKGVSREPLLDACRALKSMGEPDTSQIGAFKPGSTIWSTRTTIGYGATKTVESSDGPPRFVKYRG